MAASGFYKAALKEKSAAFRLLHRLVNPVFDHFLERIVTKDELYQAKAYAQAATKGRLTKDDVSDWMRNTKTGF